MNRAIELRGKQDIFTLNGRPVGLSVVDFWQFEFSNLVDLLGYVAEFLVAKALGKELPDNCNGWTHYDIEYRGKHIEVKASSYYQPWKEGIEICENRVYSIRPSQRESNDIYVFCLLNGRNYAEANPMLLENWEFYVVPTSVLDDECGENKTVALKRIRAFGGFGKNIRYDKIKETVDKICDSLP